MDPHRWNFIDEDVEEEFLVEEKFGRDSIICVIDCSEPMFMVKSEDGFTHFELALKVVLSLYNRKCLTNERDYLGILFYNTKHIKNTHNFESIYVFQELGMPGAERVKEIEKLINKNMDIRQNFKEKFGFADSKMDEVLWICATMFNNSGLKEGVKRIFVFTNCDNPHKNDLERQRKVQQKVQDLKEQMISIELLPVGNHFSWENFYSQLIYEDDQSVKPNPADRLEELMDRYNLIASAKTPTPLKLDKSTNEEVKTYKTFVDTETGEKLFPFELKRFQTYGGANIAMEQDEIEQLRMLYPPGLTLLGIQHKNFLKPSYYVKQSMFMYPNEANVKGSSTLFRCLLERCQAKDMVIICRLIARTNMAPRLVALLPQLEQLDAKGFQDQPPGFHVIFLPFADDVRDLTHKIMHEERPKADDLQIAKAKEIIEKLTIDYDPDTIANPVLQTHYRAIEAFALEREDMEEVADHTKPNNDWISRKAGQAIHEFTRMIFPDDYVPENNAPRKRVVGSATGATVKKSKNFDEKEEINLEEEAKSNKLHKLTVPILKELCAQNGIKLTATRKADIITQINAHYGV